MQRLRGFNYRLPVSSQTVGRWGARLVLLTLVMLAGGLLIGFVRMTWNEHKINQESQQQLATNEAQRQRNIVLRGEAEYRESPMYAEQAAREQLGMAREGETVLLPTVVLPAPAIIPAPSAAPVPPPVLGEPLPQDTPNYQRWWQALFPRAATNP
jgi:cell division protein FtsB